MKKADDKGDVSIKRKRTLGKSSKKRNVVKKKPVVKSSRRIGYKHGQNPKALKVVGSESSEIVGDQAAKDVAIVECGLSGLSNEERAATGCKVVLEVTTTRMAVPVASSSNTHSIDSLMDVATVSHDSNQLNKNDQLVNLSVDSKSSVNTQYQFPNSTDDDFSETSPKVDTESFEEVMALRDVHASTEKLSSQSGKGQSLEVSLSGMPIKPSVNESTVDVSSPWIVDAQETLAPRTVGLSIPEAAVNVFDAATAYVNGSSKIGNIVDPYDTMKIILPDYSVHKKSVEASGAGLTPKASETNDNQGVGFSKAETGVYKVPVVIGSPPENAVVLQSSGQQDMLGIDKDDSGTPVSNEQASAPSDSETDSETSDSDSEFENWHDRGYDMSGEDSGTPEILLPLPRFVWRN